MNEHDIIFTLSDKEKIVIQATDPIDELHCCYDVPIVFSDGSTAIGSDTNVRFALRKFSENLRKALEGQLKLHPSITQDLGYLANEEMQDKPGLSYRKFNGIDHWVGWDYFLWGTGGDITLNTWLYNDENGAIVFEITPSYSSYIGIKKKDPRYLSYKDWIKNYKPCVVKKIPQDVAQQWLEQVEDISKRIDDNVERIFAPENK